MIGLLHCNNSAVRTTEVKYVLNKIRKVKVYNTNYRILNFSSIKSTSSSLYIELNHTSLRRLDSKVTHTSLMALSMRISYFTSSVSVFAFGVVGLGAVG